MGGFDDVIAEALGAKVEADGAIDLGEGVELRFVELLLEVFGDAGFVVHAELDAVDGGAGGEEIFEAEGVELGEVFVGEVVDHGVAELAGALGPDAEGEVEAVVAGALGDPLEHVEVVGAGGFVDAFGVDVGEFGDVDEERVGRGEVAGLVADGEREVVEAIGDEQREVVVPKVGREEPVAFAIGIAEKYLDAAPGQEGRLGAGDDVIGEGLAGGEALGGAGEFGDGVGEAAGVAAGGDDLLIGGVGDGEGFGRGRTGDAGGGEGGASRGGDVGETDDDGVLNRGVIGERGFEALGGELGGRGEGRVDEEGHGHVSIRGGGAAWAIC